MKRGALKEDRLPPKLPVIFSADVTYQIDEISSYNQYNVNGLSAWKEYIDWLSTHVSNRAIAFDYGNNFTRYPDGTTIINNIGIGFCLEDDSKKVYVRIVWIDFNLEDFGLEIPPSLNESKKSKNTTKKVYYLTESHLRSIIKEVIKNMLLSA